MEKFNCKKNTRRGNEHQHEFSMQQSYVAYLVHREEDLYWGKTSWSGSIARNETK